MATICPTILANNPHTYREQLQRVEELSERVQIDLADGIFASPATIGYNRAYWPRNLQADIHMMYERPLDAVKNLLRSRPNIIILHAEADHEEVDESFALIARTSGVKKGLALLGSTAPADNERWLKQADHCLIFAGKLGNYGGQADMNQAKKIKEVLSINPNLEIGWDGGINDKNAAELIEAGVDVLNVGGFIQKSDDPGSAYAILQQITSTHK